MSKTTIRKIRNVVPMNKPMKYEEIEELLKEYYRWPPLKDQIVRSLALSGEFEYDKEQKTWTRVCINDEGMSQRAILLLSIKKGERVTAKKISEKYGVSVDCARGVLRKHGKFKHVGYDKNTKVFERV